MIRYTVDDMALSDVTVTQDGLWMLCVGTSSSETKASEEANGMSQIMRKYFRSGAAICDRLTSMRSIQPQDVHCREVCQALRISERI